MLIIRRHQFFRVVRHIHVTSYNFYNAAEFASRGINNKRNKIKRNSRIIQEIEHHKHQQLCA
jgi:N-glycosylase/DNA lyase